MTHTERFARRTPPEIDPGALIFMREHPDKVLTALEKIQIMEEGRAELPAIHKIPADMKTVEETLLEMQKSYFENHVIGTIARLAHHTANRQNVDWSTIVSDRHLPQIVFALIDPAILSESIRRLIPTDEGIDEAKRAELRAAANKKVEDAKTWIKLNIDAGLLHEGEFFDGPLHRAYGLWSEMTRSFIAPVDPYGCACPVESPWFAAYRTFGFQANEENGRFSPAPYDEFYYR